VFACAGDVSPYARVVVLGDVAHRSGTCCGFERQRIARVKGVCSCGSVVELKGYVSAQSSSLKCWAVQGLGARVWRTGK
jgi:hypothetical protein